MKRLVLNIFLLLSIGYSFGQEQSDSINIKRTRSISSLINISDIERAEVDYMHKKFNGHWSGLHVGMYIPYKASYDGYTDQQIDFMELDPLKSLSFYIQPVSVSIDLQRYRNTIGLVTGLGIQFQDYHLKKDIALQKSNDRIIPNYLLQYERVHKSKISSTYILVPMLLEFQVPTRHPYNRLYLSAGVVGKWRIGTYGKVKYTQNGVDQSVKSYSNYFMRDLQTAIHVRMGYRWINFFAELNTDSMFESGKGPNIIPLTVGLSLLSW